ncbi:MAG TPA: tetratricopeptide repeat protein [Isosphaeraceae bacterium]|nr:tetratricopeptide repeat protein [Isosphaeraceae bacterium]
MPDGDRATRPRYGAPITAHDLPGLCPRCRLFHTHGGQRGLLPVRTSLPAWKRRKRFPSAAIAAIGAILVGVLMSHNSWGQQPSDAAAHYNRGAALANQGKHAEASAEFRAAIRLNPEFVDAHIGLANVLDEQGKAQEAIAEYREAIRLKPNEALAHFNFAVALGRQGKTEEAIALYRTAIHLRPQHPRSHSGLGEMLIRQGKFDEAIAEIKQAIQLKSDLPESHIGLGSALQAQGKLEEAIAAYREAVRLKPNLADAHVGLAIALDDQGKADDAIAELREAVRLKPDLARAHVLLANDLINQRKLDDAIPEYREAIRLEPTNALAHVTLAFELLSARRSRREIDEALALARKAIDLDPNEAMAARVLAFAEYRTGHWAQCVSAVDRALAMQQDDATLWFIAAVAHWHKGDKDQARRWFDKAAGSAQQNESEDEDLRELWSEAAKLLGQPGPSAGGRSARAAITRGIELARNGKSNEAIAQFRAAIRQQPDNAAAHLCLGDALREAGKTDEAIAEIRTSIGLKPDVAEARSSLGDLLREQGNLTEAAIEYRAAIRLRPDDAWTHHNLGFALLGQGKVDEAIAEFREAIRTQPDLPPAHSSLAFALRQTGEFTEALAEMRKARDLGKANPRFTQGIEGALAELEQMVGLEKKLPSVLSGQVKPTSAAEALGFAKLCQRKNLYGASARFWAEAFQSDRALADDANARNRYNAACAAALAGSGQAKSEPPLDLAAQARLRRQALDWLKAELAAWNTKTSGNDPQARAEAAETLKWWQADTDLASVRGADALDRLPESERNDWQALWADVETVLKRARGG